MKTESGEYVFAATWSLVNKEDARIAVWVGGTLASILDVPDTHPEVRRLRDGTWAMVTLDWSVQGEVAPLMARLWRASGPGGPWTSQGTVYSASSRADAAGFSVDYWCRSGGRWLLFMSGYPAGGQGSSMTLAEADRMEGPYSRTRVLLSPMGAQSPLINGLPLMAHNLSPSSVYLDEGRWTMIGTGYGTTAEGEWYERTFLLHGPSVDGPWSPSGEIAFVAPLGLASFENAEPALADETCEGGGF